MTLEEVRQILERHGIVTNQYGNPLDFNQNTLGITADVYSVIKNMNDPLSDEEHILLFDTFWTKGSKEHKSDVRISDALKIKFINYRKRVSRFDMLAAGHLEGSNIPNLVEECGLNESEEAELWNVFHKLWHHDSARDCEEINSILGTYKIVEHKLKWLGKINVLDIGCGKNGNGISTLAARYQGKIMGYGVDLDIQEHPSNVKLFRANVKHLPFRDNFFEVVYSCNVIGYFKGQRHLQIIKEILRILKPKGIFVFDDYNRYADTYKNLIMPELRIKAKILYVRGKNHIIIIKL